MGCKNIKFLELNRWKRRCLVDMIVLADGINIILSIVVCFDENYMNLCGKWM